METLNHISFLKIVYFVISFLFKNSFFSFISHDFNIVYYFDLLFQGRLLCGSERESVCVCICVRLYQCVNLHVCVCLCVCV